MKETQSSKDEDYAFLSWEMSKLVEFLEDKGYDVVKIIYG